ncbi:iduronate-2-sulfatase [Lunatimonas lonarensis]|uniref:Iduronate-2-sulfatase n=2 Tax=Lunatimonas lonarensis TaxID=1232681 RepID=R7ZWZ1_9BACT|nr:iduronate-2-sulfatase [Lunatimonas lonarensis]
MPGTDYYEQLIQKAREAAAFGIIKGVIWHQGESDLGKLDTYMSDLEKLIQRIRADMELPQLPFVAGEIAEDQPGRDAFNRLLMQLPGQVPHTAVVSSKGTKTFDEVHFDTKSQLKLGKRYAQKMKNLTHPTHEL